MLRSRRLFSALALFALSALWVTPSFAGAKKRTCIQGVCKVLKSGHVRGRTPVACVSIPFVKKGHGQVAMFVLRDFNPHASPTDIQEQLKHALFKDSKVTGPVDDFCRGRKKFGDGRWVVICDDDSIGWITGASLAYTLRFGHPPENRRVQVGTAVARR